MISETTVSRDGISESGIPHNLFVICSVILVRRWKDNINTNVKEVGFEDSSGHGSCSSDTWGEGLG